ncbi:MAG: hemoblobin-interacting domain-containing protein [Anaerotignum lactatifermentans]|nr:hemoblobin-interacting domain-containing protein [Anaerotignum lactatifermentans]
MLTFAENGYIAGDGTGNYLPNQIMTRAQFAAVINRVMGYTEESPSIANYTDVEDSAWYRSDLAKALSAGYMSGTSATTMSPNQPVTREQAAVMIVRLLEENTSVDLSVLDDFTDRGDISAFAVNAMAKLISDGYLYGADGKLMPQKSMTRAEGIALLSRSMDALKDTNLEEEKEETKTEEKDNSNKGSSGGSSGGGSSSGGGGSSSGGGGSSKPSQNIAKAAQTKLVDLGRSQYVVVSFEEGFSKDNTKLIIDGVDVTSNFTNVDDDGTIVKWELTSLNPAKLVLESGNSKQEVKLTNNQNPEKPEVLASVPESYNLMANGAVAVWDYHLTNYDEDGDVRVYPEKTTFDLDASDESIPYYSPDAEVTEEGAGVVIVMFNYSTAEEQKWFDDITDVDLVAFNENNNTLNDELRYTTKQIDHNGKTVGQISIPLGQSNFNSNGRYNIRVTSGGQSWLFPIHVVNETAPSMHLQGNGGTIQSGKNVHFHVENMVYGITMPVYRVTLTAPDGEIKELEKITDYYLIGDLFVLYNDIEGHNNIPDNGKYTIKVYAEGFKPMETTFVVGSGVNNAITYAGADAVTMATFDGGGSSGGDGGSNVMNAYLIFDSDLLANAEILTELGIEQESAAKIAERWNQDMTSWLYVFDKGGKVFYDYSGKRGAFTNMVSEAEAHGEYLTFAEFQKEETASVTQNRPYAAKYVLEDNLLGETQMGGSYIGRPAPELTVVESQEGSDLKLSCADTAYLAAIAEDGEIYLNGDYMNPLEKGDFTVNLDDSTLTIAKNKLELGKNTIRISVGGYQDKEIEVEYDKTVEETDLEVEAGNVRETVTVTVAGENATGDIWEYLKVVKLTYPDGTERKVLPDGQESVYDEKIGYEISGKNLILGKDLFTQAGEYQVTITAEYYDKKTVKFTVGDGTSTETKPVPQYDKVECKLDTFWPTKYTFVFTSSYNDKIEAWIKAINKVAVNGTEYSSSMVADLYFTTNTTDLKIILYGDKPFKDGDNTVVISAEGYKDLTLIVGKDGTIGGDTGENPEEPEEDQAAPTAESFRFVDEFFGDDYYRLKFNLTEDDASAYLEAITSIEIDGEACEKVQSFWQHTNSYKFSNDLAYGGGEYQFIDFTADCFAEADKSYTVEIIAGGYETLTLKIENNSLVDGDEPTEPEENKAAPSVNSLVFKNEMLSSYYRLSFDLSVTDAAAYLNVITSIEIDGNSCEKVSGLWNETNSYKFSNNEAYGWENQFIDFTEDCFSGERTHTLTISADGYKTLTYTYPAQ